MALIVFLVFSAWAPLGAQDQQVPKSLARFTDAGLAPIGRDAALVRFVEAQNRKGVSPARIRELDQAWIAEKGISSFMRSLLDSPCSARLKQLTADLPFILEAFIMDNQGALAGLTSKTSDYWQGDEAKFTESFKAGEGAVHLGQLEYDRSVGATVVQISVPVVQGGRAIGAITFGVSVDAWERR